MDDKERLRLLKTTREQMITLGVDVSDIDVKIQVYNRPRVGETMFLDKNQEAPVVIVNVDTRSPSVMYVPDGTKVGSTHKGNLYDELGVNIYCDSH